MTEKRTRPDNLHERAHGLARELASLAAEAAASDPALRAQLDAALRALDRKITTRRNTALLSNQDETRRFVRDVVADELERYWERRFGGTP